MTANNSEFFDEKAGVEMAGVEVRHLECSTPSSKPSSAEAGEHERDIDAGFDAAFVKRTIRKIDWRMIPILSAMYCVSLMDRVNLSYARAANNAHMDTELGTGGTNNRYSIITVMFFVPYVILEIPVS
jgi:hypothetical protein